MELEYNFHVEANVIIRMKPLSVCDLIVKSAISDDE